MRIFAFVVLAFVVAAASCGGDSVPATCATNADCFDGYACDTAGAQICLRSCTEATVATDCLAGQACVIPDGAANGVCKTAAAAAD